MFITEMPTITELNIAEFFLPDYTNIGLLIKLERITLMHDTKSKLDTFNKLTRLKQIIIDFSLLSSNIKTDFFTKIPQVVDA